MLRLYRELSKGEFFVVWGDTAQGGADANYVQFLSQTKGDIPMVLKMNAVAAEMTPQLREALHYIFDHTGVRPVVAVERQNGGASVMHDLITSNTDGKYTIYYAKGADEVADKKPGWDTTTLTRPKMLGEWLTAFNSKLIKIYDKDTIDQHHTFIVNKNGKPEAAPNTHDDAVMSCAGAWQLYQTEVAPADDEEAAYTGGLRTFWG